MTWGAVPGGVRQWRAQQDYACRSVIAIEWVVFCLTSRGRFGDDEDAADHAAKVIIEALLALKHERTGTIDDVTAVCVV